MQTKPYSPVKRDEKEAEAVAQDEKEAEDKEEDEKEEEKVEELDAQHQVYYYCRRADIDGIKSVSSKITDINARDEKGSKNNPYISHNTALHYAVLSGSLEVVKVVYDLGAKLDSPNKLGSTPLHLAASLGYTEIVKYLIEVKADMEATNNIKNTPLHCAVYAGHVDTVKVILNHCDDKRESLMLPTNGVGFGAVKYTAHDDMKAYLKQFFPKKQSSAQNNIDVEEEEEQEQQPPPTQNTHGNDVQEEEESDHDIAYSDDERMGLKTGQTNITAAEQ